METRFCSDGAEKRREAQSTSAVIRITKNPARNLPTGIATFFVGVPSCSFVSFVVIAFFFIEFLFQRINSKTAEQLRIEIGGLLRQHLAGKSDVSYLFHANRIHQKSHVGFTTSHLSHGIASIADVPNILLI